MANTIKDIKSFAGASMNLDVGELYLEPNQFREVRNTHLLSSEGDEEGYAENYLGNTQISTTVPSGINKVVGTAKDPGNRHIYYLIYNSSKNHCIKRVNIDTRVVEDVLYEENVLNFQKNGLLDVNYLSGLLFWSGDDVNPPRSIDVSKAANYTDFKLNGTSYTILEAYLLGVTSQILDMIKYPPLDRPRTSYESDTNYNYNNLKGKLFQFKYRYTYDNNEQSVFSAISEVETPEGSELFDGSNIEDQVLNNRINVEFNAGTTEVHQIEIAVRESNIGHWRIVKVFDRYNSLGNELKDSTGASLTSLPSAVNVYWFYNDTIGDTLDQEDAARGFDYIPKLAATQEIIEKNRIVYANLKEGFDNVQIDVELINSVEAITKIENQIVCKVNEIDVGTPAIETYYQFRLDRDNSDNPIPAYINRVYRLRLRMASDSGYNNGSYVNYDYRSVTGDTFTSIKTALIALVNNDTVFQSSADDDFGLGTGDWLYVLGYDSPDGYLVDGNLYILSEQETFDSFKAGAYHNFGLVYYDNEGRNGSVNISDDSTIQVPVYLSGIRTNLDYRNRINWNINHTPPSWASYYRWVYTKNTSISFFQYFHIKGPASTDYVINGDYITININAQLTFQIDNVNPSINIPLYTDWQKGDRLRWVAGYNTTTEEYTLYEDLHDYEILKAEDDSGVYKITINEPASESILMDMEDFVLEVYRPRKALPDVDNDRTYYEVGPKYEISGGVHSTDSGTFDFGDVYWRRRFGGVSSDLPIESSSFSDFYDSESVSIGRVNVTNPEAKEQNLITTLRFGGLFIQNSQINDLSKFEADNYETISEKFGSINKIVEVSYILKVLQDTKVTSIYLNRQSMEQAKYQGGVENIIVGTTDVLGFINPSSNRYGCVNPESVLIVGRRMYYADLINGLILRDGSNGTVPVSNYGVKDWVRDTFKDMAAKLNYLPRVYTHYDAKHNKVGFTFCYDNNLEGSSSYDYSEVIDTIIFSDHPDNKWTSYMDYWKSATFNPAIGDAITKSVSPDRFEHLGDDLISFMQGALYIHNDNSLHSNFYGTQFSSSITLSANAEPIVTKEFTAISYIADSELLNTNETDGKIVDLTIDATDNYPTGMVSKLSSANFLQYEGERRAAILKDMYTGAEILNPTESLAMLFNGRSLRGKHMKVKFTHNSSGKVIIKLITVISQVSF